MASIAINDRRVELLLGFTGINYYGAQNAARFDRKFKPFYERVASRKGSYKAIVAVRERCS